MEQVWEERDFKSIGSRDNPCWQSDIKDYLECSLRWSFKKKVPREARYVSGHAAIGSAVHKAVADFFTKGKTPSTIRDLAEEEIDKSKEKIGGLNSDVYWRTGSSIDKEINTFDLVLDKFYTKEYNLLLQSSEFSRVRSYCEIAFLVNIGGYWFEGTVDHIIADGSGLTMRDYKTGINKPSQFLLDNDYQFFIYSCAALSGEFVYNMEPISFKTFPMSFQYNMRGHEVYKKKTRVGIDEKGTIHRMPGEEKYDPRFRSNMTASKIPVMSKYLTEVVNDMRRGKFFPSLPALGGCTGRCQFNDMCEAGLSEPISEATIYTNLWNREVEGCTLGVQ